MRVLILFLLLAVTQILALPNEQLMKIATTEITLIMGSGIISELFYPSNAPKAINKTTQNNPTDHPVAGDLFTGTAIGVLNIIISFYTCKKVHRYMPFCIFVGSIYGHIAAAIATHHIKNFFIDLYKF